MKVDFFFAWYDLWVGAYYDGVGRILYICPLPCCVIRARFWGGRLPLSMNLEKK